MEFCRRIAECLVGLFFGIESPKSNLLSLELNPGNPTIEDFGHPFESAPVGTSHRGIASVLVMACFSQVAPTVVVLSKIFVVYFICRPCLRYQKPNQRVFWHNAAEYRDCPVSTFDKGPGALAVMSLVKSRAISECKSPDNHTRSLIVRKQPLNFVPGQRVALCYSACNFGLSHLTLLRSLVRSRASRLQRVLGFAIMPQLAPEA